VQHLGKDELLRFLGVAKATRERDWLMFLVAYWHGLRASEVVSLERGAIANGCLTVHRLKGSDTTTQPLVEDPEPLLNERAALETLARTTPPFSPIFPFSRVHYFRLFRKYAKRAGLPEHKWHPHTLKHSVARHHIREMGIENMRKYLGHKSMASTGEYLKVTDEEASAALARARRQKANGEEA
jgi:integrase/recombinase XerD